jgi:hypothetical protein
MSAGAAVPTPDVQEDFMEIWCLLAQPLHASVAHFRDREPRLVRSRIGSLDGNPVRCRRAAFTGCVLPATEKGEH